MRDDGVSKHCARLVVRDGRRRTSVTGDGDDPPEMNPSRDDAWLPALSSL